MEKPCLKNLTKNIAIDKQTNKMHEIKNPYAYMKPTNTNETRVTPPNIFKTSQKNITKIILNQNFLEKRIT